LTKKIQKQNLNGQKVLNELKGGIINYKNFKVELKGAECKAEFKFMENIKAKLKCAGILKQKINSEKISTIKTML